MPLVFGCLAAFPPVRALAQEGWIFADHPGTVSLYFENDSRTAKPNDPSDRHYTNGLGLSIAGREAWAQTLADQLCGGGDAAAGLIIGQLMFTPSDITARHPDPHDQPYAGYLFTGLYWQRDNGNRAHGVRATSLDHIQLELGLVGPASGAEQLQKSFHEIIGADEPEGWDAQLGHEVTGQLTYRHKWRADLLGNAGEGGFAVQAIPAIGLAAGTVYRHLEAGGTLRIGLNLPDDFGPGRLGDPASATGQVLGGARFGAYAFVRATGWAVEHNLFLNGNTFHGSPGVETRPLVGELQAGVATQLALGENCALEVIYSQTFQTLQFRTQEEPDSYGALTLALTCVF